jgi:hypothetical protein
MPLCEIYIRSHLSIIEGNVVATHATFKFYLKKPPVAGTLKNYVVFQSHGKILEQHDTHNQIIRINCYLFLIG